MPRTRWSPGKYVSRSASYPDHSTYCPYNPLDRRTWDSSGDYSTTSSSSEQATKPKICNSCKKELHLDEPFHYYDRAWFCDKCFQKHISSSKQNSERMIRQVVYCASCRKRLFPDEVAHQYDGLSFCDKCSKIHKSE